MTVQTYSAPVEPIPPVHSVGDPNHTPDHNSIVQVLTDYDTDIGNLQGQAANMFSVAGGNVCNIAGTTTSLATVNLPSGNRDSAADTLDVMCAGVKVFSLNGYGELRVAPALATHIGAIIKAQAGQTADLFQLQDSSGNVLARFTSNGTLISTQPLTALQPGTSNPETWHTMTSFQNGFAASGVAGQPPNPMYKLLPDGRVAFRGGIVTPGGSSQVTVLTFYTLPVGYRPATYYARWAANSNTGNQSGNVYIMPNGNMQLSGSFGNNINLDISGATSIDSF